MTAAAWPPQALSQPAALRGLGQPRLPSPMPQPQQSAVMWYGAQLGLIKKGQTDEQGRLFVHSLFHVAATGMCAERLGIREKS